jgi:hypothetical protein
MTDSVVEVDASGDAKKNMQPATSMFPQLLEG